MTDNSINALRSKLAQIELNRARARALDNLQATLFRSREKVTLKGGDKIRTWFRKGDETAMMQEVTLTQDEARQLDAWIEDRARALRSDADRMEREIAEGAK